MVIKTISATYGIKANLGDYSSADVSITLWADLDPSDSPTECLGVLQEQARLAVNEQLYPLVGHIDARVTQLFGGKPVVQGR